MPFDKSKLPQLTVTGLRGKIISGQLSKPTEFKQGQWASILLDDGTISVKLTRLPRIHLLFVFTGRFPCKFELEKGAQIESIHVGESYYILDGYWGDLAHLVLDGSLEWQKVTFQPSDAIKYQGESDAVLTKAVTRDTSGRGVIVTDGWDHEHCDICSVTISHLDGYDPLAYRSQYDNWLCVRCYEQFVYTRSLDFIDQA
jgi:hypothetical protein